MRSRITRTLTWLGGRLTRLRRWLGWDRNPLRRGTDRIEGALRLVTLILVLVAVPLVTIAVGRQADHLAIRDAQAQRATEHLVNAVLLENAPATGVPDPYSSIQTAWVKARWQPPGRPARTGVVLVMAGARAGSTVPTWIDASGAVAVPPPDHRDIVGDVWVAVVTACLVSLTVLLGSAALLRRGLDHRRLSKWDAEWRASGPLWTGRRG